MLTVRFIRTVALTVLLLLGSPAGRACAQDDQHSDLITPETDLAIQRALAFLAERQHADGSFGSGGIYRRNVAVTSLCGMAFLSSGSTAGRGPYGGHVSRSVDFILSMSKASGYIIAADSSSHGPMYGHGFATMYLAEVYGMVPDPKVKEALQRAVRLIVNSQSPDGGWRYYPESKDADVSVTVCQIMALRAARNAGLFVPKDTVDRCTNYVRKCQNPDGRFRYQLNRQPESQFPRSAAGLVALYSAGTYEGQEVDSAISCLMRYLPQGDIFRFESHYYYGQYYAAQAMWLTGKDRWKTWYPAVREDLLRRQFPDGSWPDSSICSEYGTAMALIVLQLPNDTVPIFQR